MRRFELLLNGKVYLVEVTRVSSDGALVNVNGTQYEVGVNDLSRVEIPKMMKVAEAPAPCAGVTPQAGAATETVGGLTTVKAPLPGLIIDIKVKVGDRVNVCDVLLVIETMKMENNVVSPRVGTIKEVKVSKDMTVNEGSPLVVIGD
ncbi:MAG: biotin/lipoyl-binding protein [Candidatus Abyssubacteria bacterium]